MKLSDEGIKLHLDALATIGEFSDTVSIRIIRQLKEERDRYRQALKSLVTTIHRDQLENAGNLKHTLAIAKQALGENDADR